MKDKGSLQKALLTTLLGKAIGKDINPPVSTSDDAITALERVRKDDKARIASQLYDTLKHVENQHEDALEYPACH